MKRLSIILLIVIFPLSVSAADKWSTQDIVLESAFAVLHVIDWGQTLSIVGDHDFEESNPIVGKDPSRARVNLFGIGILLGHIAITHFLPSEWRPYWQVAGICVKGFAVAHNYSIGVTIDF